MSTRRRIGTLPALLLGGVLALGGCGEDGPSGPGALDGEVRAPDVLGAVVLHVEGTGIEAIDGTAGTRAFVGPRVGEAHKVILVGDGTADLRFEIDVQDLAAPRPTATVESAVDTSNQDVAALSGIDVRLTVR